MLLVHGNVSDRLSHSRTYGMNLLKDLLAHIPDIHTLQRRPYTATGGADEVGVAPLSTTSHAFINAFLVKYEYRFALVGHI